SSDLEARGRRFESCQAHHPLFHVDSAHGNQAQRPSPHRELLGHDPPGAGAGRAPQALYFIADYHALTTLHAGDELRLHTREVAATWLALGLDPERSLLYRQSDVPEVMELAWI